MVRDMLPPDSEKVLEIYRMGIETRNATFETIVPSWQDWNERHLSHSRFVSEEPQRRHREPQSFYDLLSI